ncbi:MAG TPA: glycerophosphodiester phosphodiesterase family protein [Gemmataceae bacterium]|nr:glycerophosphodiester phosphodiesterase family protein [Gemmataceae bacterium]
MPSPLSPLRRGGTLPAPVLNIAHRGARAFAPENTLEAFASAARLGCHMVELDVHLSKDGELIVIHDDDLVRCSNVQAVFSGRAPWFVSDVTADEIAKLDAGSWYVAELGKPATERQAYLRDLTNEERTAFVSDADLARYGSGAVRHPTLREALDFTRGLGLLLNVEIKSLPRGYPGIAEKVVRLIDNLGAASRVLVSSFDHQQLAAVRRLSNAIATATLVSDRLHEPGRYVREFLDADAYHPGCAGSCDTLGLDSVRGKVDVEVIRDVRAAGLGVNVWTENDAARMRALIEAGVTGIFTDYPNRLRDVLAARLTPAAGT